LSSSLHPLACPDPWRKSCSERAAVWASICTSSSLFLGSSYSYPSSPEGGCIISLSKSLPATAVALRALRMLVLGLSPCISPSPCLPGPVLPSSSSTSALSVSAPQFLPSFH
jgi:hypothetical protein